MDSETLTEQHFLPLLFDRLEWKRDPSSLPDGNGSRSLLDSETLNIETTSNNDQFGLDGGLIPDQPSGFGNLPFSSGVLANHYPMGVQQQQHENLFRPLWAILPLTTLAGKPSVKECIAGVLRQARLLLQSGQSTEQIIGRKCNIASIFDQNQFSRSTMLTKWAARFVYSMQHKDHDFVAFAAMHLVWTLTRWMISPRPDTYEAVPEWYRPTMLQLWTPHVEIVDFVLWPALRDKVTREPQVLQSDWRWLEHICQSIDCDWFVDLDVALEVNGNTGECYLTDAAKVRRVRYHHAQTDFPIGMLTLTPKESAEQLSNWSVAGSAGQHFDAVESFTKVRPMPF